MKKIVHLTVCLMFLFTVSKAQTDLYNTGQLYLLNSSDTVYITGSMSNTGTAILNNTAGNLFVLNNLQNDQPDMNAGAGKLWFTGTAVQNITGTQPMRTNNWIVDNLAGVNLQNRIGVGNGTAGTLSFIRGIIYSGNNLQDVFFYPNSNYSGYSDKNHIIGYCHKSGGSNFSFPIGNGTLKADLEISNMISITNYQCKYFGNGYADYRALSPLIEVFDKEYWTLDRTAGTSPTQITLKWNDARNTLNHSMPKDMRVTHFKGNIWTSEGGIGSGNTTTGTVTSIAVNSFSPFTFGSVGFLLPVKISDFKATVNSSCAVSVNWKAQDGSGVLKYIVQKTVGGDKWDDVAAIVNTDESAYLQSYQFTDKAASAGIWLYRIKTLNKDGSFFYTESKMVKLSCNNGQVAVYPTITKTVVNVTINHSAEIKSVRVFNSNGQIIFIKTGPIKENQQIDFSTFNSGIYNVVVDLGYDLKNFQIIKIQ